MSKQKNIIELIKSRIPARQDILGQFLRYFVTGGLASIADFGVFAIAIYGLSIHYLIANLIGLAAGNVVNYLLTIKWVFSTEKRKMGSHRALEIFVFVLISLLGMGFNEGLMYIFVGMLGVQEIISKVAAAIIVLLWNFAARKFILFQNGDKNVAKTEKKDS